MMHVSKYQLHFCACGGCKDQLQTDRVFFRTSDATLNTCAGGGSQPDATKIIDNQSILLINGLDTFIVDNPFLR